MIVIICAILAVGAIGFTLLVRERDIPSAPVENPELKHLETQRQVLYENLKDLQFEYHQGKLSDADYQSVKAGFLDDLAGVMASIEQLLSGKEKAKKEATEDHRDPEARRKSQLEKEKAGREAAAEEAVAKQKPASGDHHIKKAAWGLGIVVAKQESPSPDQYGSSICSACGAENPGHHRFCGQCGAALSESLVE